MYSHGPSDCNACLVFQMTGKRTRSFKCAVHHRDREVSSENDFHILVQEPPVFRRMVRIIADEFLTEERDRKYYADHYTCCPPPLFIVLITLVESTDHSYTIEYRELQFLCLVWSPDTPSPREMSL
uniref:Uncharacterized protein n=1 Tax=Timema bartmani TaxID=61472 RepID=A0A7R9FD63_9NEOP|nr:unnamed protein product [Timema bartmani]